MRKEETLRRVYRRPLLSEEQLKTISEAHVEIEIKKGEFFLTKGEISKSFLILDSGLMRSYLYNYEGNEITTHFFSEQEVVIDVLSLFSRALKSPLFSGL